MKNNNRRFLPMLAIALIATIALLGGFGVFADFVDDETKAGQVFTTNEQEIPVEPETTTEQECEHVYGKWIIDKDASCKEEGLKHRDCLNCDFTQQKEIKKIPHSVVTDQAVEPTCKDTGLTEGSHCSVCNEVIDEQKVVPVTNDHTYDDYRQVTGDNENHNVYCSVCENAYITEPHSWDEGEYTDAECEADAFTTYTCEDCDYVKIVTHEDSALGHDFVDAKVDAVGDGTNHTVTCNNDCGTTQQEACFGGEATCTDLAKCEKCGEAYGELAAHIFDYESAPTASDGNQHYYLCTVCEVEKEFEACDSNVVIPEVEAKCEETGLTEGAKCSKCDQITVKQEVTKELGHDYQLDHTDEATCTENGTEYYVCANDESHKKTETINAKGHSYRDVITAPTCTDIGFTTNICPDCGNSTIYPDSIVDALGHTEVIDERQEPTCTETGLSEGKHCSVCDEILVKQEELSALGHTEVIDERQEPTCTETGLTEGKHCSVCDEILEPQETVDALGHIEVIDERQEPTCTETGLTEGKHCLVCEEILEPQETVDALGHIEVIDERIEPTCTETGLTEGKHCSVCEEILEPQEELSALGHTEVVDEAKEPTCAGIGLTEGSHCSVCGEILEAQEEIPALKHNEVIDEAKDPTCSKMGLTEGSHCSVCGEVLKPQGTIAALGHIGGTATCVELATCTRCGEKYGSLGLNNHLNVVEDKAYPSSCTSFGKTAGSHCTVCGRTVVPQNNIAKSSHTFASWTTIVAPTCANEGVQESVCTVCGTNETRSIAKTTAHNYKDVVTTKATLSGNGVLSNKCSLCGSVKSNTTIAKISSVTLSKTSYTYDGKAKKPTVTVKDSSGKVLKSGTDYSVSYASGRKNIGSYTVKVTFKGNYSGTKSLTFKIVPAKVTGLKATSQSTTNIMLSWKKVSGAEGYVVYKYDSSKKAYVKVKSTTGASYKVTGLKAGTTYKFKVRAYKKVNGSNVYGAYSSVLSTATKTKAPTLTVKAGSGKATLNWNKLTGATGYQVYMATSKDGKYKKVTTIKKAGTVKYTAKDLTAGKTYYFKVRAYKTVGGKNIFSNYSSVVKVKVK